MATSPFRILIADPSPDEAAKTARSLQGLEARGFATTWAHVETFEAFTAALVQERWDMLLVEDGLGGADRKAMLDVMVAHRCNSPFVVVAERLDTQARLFWLQGGACDVMQKNAMHDQLTPLVEREQGEGCKCPLARRVAEDKYKALVEQLPAIIYRAAIDDESTTLFVSPQVEKVLGISVEEYEANPDIWRQQLHPEDRERVMAEVSASHQSKGPFSSEYRMHTRDNRVLWFRDEAYVATNREGDVLYLQGVMFDITAQKEMEAALSDSEQRYSTLFENAGDAIYVHDKDGVIVEVNRIACERLDYSRDELVGMNIFSIGAREQSAETASWWPYLRMQGPDCFETFHFKRDGTPLFTEIKVSPFTYKGDEMLMSVGRDITQRVHYERALKESEERFRSLAETTGDFIWEVDEKGVYTYVSAKIENILGYAPEDVLGRKPADFHLPEEWGRFKKLSRPFWEERAPLVRIEHAMIRKDGEIVILEVSGEAVFNAAGQFTGYRGVESDVTEQRQAEAAVQASEKKYRSLFEHATEGIFQAPVAGGFSEVNPAMARILGYDSPQEVLERFHESHAQLFVDLSQREEMTQILRDKGVLRNFEVQCYRKDGAVIWGSVNARAVYCDSGELRHVEGTVVDVTARKKAEGQLYFQAYHDPLTRLPNRTLLQNHLIKALHRLARRQGYIFAVLFLDLDDFKKINDSLGHTTGDAMLEHAAKVVRESIRSLDTVARFGGDEFVVLLEELESYDEALQVAKRIQQSIRKPMKIEGHTLYMTASQGLVLPPQEYKHPEDMIRYANIAMRRAKTEGKNRIEVFEAGMLENVKRYLDLETDLHQAFERKEFFLEYQPIVDLGTGRPTAVEALVRWSRNGGEIVPPGEFISVAEESGLIVPLGEWILEESCLRIAELNKKYPQMKPVSVSVNISGRQFYHYDLADLVDDILKKTGLAPRFLKLEITENVIMENAELNIRTLKKLKKLGVKLAIDDFGTGYSSLSYLQRFPIDMIKIDRCFITDMAQNKGNREIVKAIISLAHSLGKSVIAEGVEYDEHIAMLAMLGCEFGQGYLYSRPISMAAVEEFVGTR